MISYIYVLWIKASSYILIGVSLELVHIMNTELIFSLMQMKTQIMVFMSSR